MISGTVNKTYYIIFFPPIILDFYFTFVWEGVKPSVNMNLLGLNLKCKCDTVPQMLHLWRFDLQQCILFYTLHLFKCWIWISGRKTELPHPSPAIKFNDNNVWVLRPLSVSSRLFHSWFCQPLVLSYAPVDLQASKSCTLWVWISKNKKECLWNVIM